MPQCSDPYFEHFFILSDKRDRSNKEVDAFHDDLEKNPKKMSGLRIW